METYMAANEDERKQYDIQLIVGQTSCTIADAESALKSHHGDIVDSIMNVPIPK